MRRQIKAKMMLLYFILSLCLPSLSIFVPSTSAATANLNTLMLSQYDKYLAWLIRYSDLNGTNVCLYDKSDFAITSQSVGMALYALHYLATNTSNPYYYALLKAWVDGIIDNSDNYRTVDVGEIFYAISFKWSDGESADTAVMPTAFTGSACVYLYHVTGNNKYRILAERIASESLNKLPVINNATDLAWSCAYFSGRTETNAKKGVNRQTSMAVFYALMGEHINATYSSYVQRIIHWTWRAQLASKLLAYHIGASAASYPYSAYATFEALEAYRINSTNFADATLKSNIAATVSALISERGAPYNYGTHFFYAGALGKALQTDYFASYSNASYVKGLTYAALTNMHFTEVGYKTELSDSEIGFRWSQHPLGTFFAGVYPLSDADFNITTDWLSYIVQTAAGSWKWNGLLGESILTDIDAIRDGANSYGVGIKTSNVMLGFTTLYPSYTPVASIFQRENHTYYQKIFSRYVAKDVNVTQYLYPSAGVYMADVTGSVVSQLRTTNLAIWKIVVANGTVYDFQSLTNNQYHVLGTQFMIVYNDTKPNARSCIFVSTQNATYGKFLATSLYLNYTHTTSHRIIFAILTNQANSSQYEPPARQVYPDLGVVHNHTEAFTVLKALVDAFNTTQPVSYDLLHDTYSGLISARQPDASWLSLYQTSQSGTAKLIGHNLPQVVSVTAWAETSGKLSLTVSAPSGVTSVTQIYLGSKGEPKSVSGPSSWSYDPVSEVLTISRLHSSSVRMIIYWKFPGDIDGDNYVNANDLYLLAKAYGMHLGDPSYNSESDIDSDGDIDADDLSIFAENYGRH